MSQFIRSYTDHLYQVMGAKYTNYKGVVIEEVDSKTYYVKALRESFMTKELAQSAIDESLKQMYKRAV